MKKIFLFVIAAFSFASLCAQNADFVTQIIDAENLSYAQASYLCAVQKGVASEDASFEEAYQALEKDLFGSVKHNADDSIKLCDAAYLLAQTWNVKSSFMYCIFKTPRYAFNMLKADKIVDENADPAKKISGHEFLNMFSSCLDKYGE